MPRRRGRPLIRSVAPPAVTLLGLLLVWELVTRLFRIPPYLLPPPSEVMRVLARSGELWRATWTSTQAAMIGFGLSALAGTAAAVALSSTRLIERSFYPFTVFLQTVPLVAVAPLLSVWFGYGLKPVAVSAFIVSVFPVIANTLTGLRSTDPALRDLFRLYGASPAATLFKLKLPSALPSIFTGLRIAAGLAVIGTVVGEFSASFAGRHAGLGVVIVTHQRAQETDVVFAAVVLASLLGLVMFSLVGITGHLLLRRWHASAQ